MNDIFSIAAGFPVFGPQASFAKRRLREIIRDNFADYQEVESPAVAPASLFEKSGHLANYRENMFPLAGKNLDRFDGDDAYNLSGLYLKPMNCPYHIAVFDYENRSYKELPFRVLEFGKVFRNEDDGALSQFRYNQFEQDDGHVFVDPAKMEEEIGRMIDIFLKVYLYFSLDVNVELSLRGGKRIGDELQWDVAEECLRSYLREKNVPFVEKVGEAAFYGPKIDFKVNDSQGRSWQLGTIQLDFFLCGRFKVEYVDDQNERREPVLIHRAVYGSLERFLQILINLDKVPNELYKNLVYWIPMGERFKNLSEAYLCNLGREDRSQHVIDQNYDAPLAERIKQARLKGFRSFVVYGEKEAAQGGFSGLKFQPVKK